MGVRWVEGEDSFSVGTMLVDCLISIRVWT